MSLARLAPLVLLVALAGCGSAHVKHVSPPATVTTSQAAPPPKAKSVATIPGGPGNLAAMAGPRGLTLRDRPGGRVIAHLRPATEWGSPTVVWAAQRRGRWLGVYATATGNNRIAWLD